MTRGGRSGYGRIVLRLIASATIALLADALGLIVAALILDDIHLDPLGFVVAVFVFAVVDLLIQPLLRQTAIKQAPALVGSSALIATIVSFAVTGVVTDGLTIDGALGWVLGPVIVWAVALVAQLLLPLVIFKKTLARRNDGR